MTVDTGNLPTLTHESAATTSTGRGAVRSLQAISGRRELRCLDHARRLDEIRAKLTGEPCRR